MSCSPPLSSKTHSILTSIQMVHIQHTHILTHLHPNLRAYINASIQSIEFHFVPPLWIILISITLHNIHTRTHTHTHIYIYACTSTYTYRHRHGHWGLRLYICTNASCSANSEYVIYLTSHYITLSYILYLKNVKYNSN